jgi:hypothetical protein
VAVGGRTQLTSVVSISILFVVIYAAGSLFTDLPKVISRLYTSEGSFLTDFCAYG